MGVCVSISENFSINALERNEISGLQHLSNSFVGMGNLISEVDIH
jgi:hypothetical protein